MSTVPTRTEQEMNKMTEKMRKKIALEYIAGGKDLRPEFLREPNSYKFYSHGWFVPRWPSLR